MPKTKKLAFMALLTAMALTIFVLEAQIPAPVPIPGVKLGLANIITLTAMVLMGRKEAGIILAMRILMGATKFEEAAAGIVCGDQVLGKLRVRACGRAEGGFQPLGKKIE